MIHKASRVQISSPLRTETMQQVDVNHYYSTEQQSVWDVYSDHAGWREWAMTPGSHLVKEGTTERDGSGAVRGFLGGLREEILDFEPPKRMTYRVIGGLFPIKNHMGEVLLESEGDGTRLIWRCRFDPMIPGTGALLQRFISWTFRRSLAGLERYLNAR